MGAWWRYLHLDSRGSIQFSVIVSPNRICGVRILLIFIQRGKVATVLPSIRLLNGSRVERLADGYRFVFLNLFMTRHHFNEIAALGSRNLDCYTTIQRNLAKDLCRSSSAVNIHNLAVLCMPPDPVYQSRRPKKCFGPTVECHAV